MVGSPYKNKNLVITGGLGFIGSNLAIKLFGLGAKITLVDAKIKDTGWNMRNLEPIKGRVKVTAINISSSKMVTLIKNADFIFNLAGVLSHVDALANPLNDLEINTVDHLKFLEMCRKYNTKVKIIYTGTRNQYGRISKNPVDEKSLFDPIDPNGVSEIASELYYHLYYKLFGIKFVSIRLCNVFGPRHQMRHSKQGVLNWFIKQIMEGQEISLMGGGEQVRDCIYVDDLVEALIKVGVSEKVWGETFNIGCYPLSLKGFVQKVIKTYGDGKFKTVSYPPDRKLIEIGDYIANYSKLTKFTGWKPKWKFEDAIMETIKFYSDNKKFYF